MQSNQSSNMISRDELVSQATDEYFELCSAGQAPEIDAFLAKYATIQEVLRTLLPALDVLRDATKKRDPLFTDHSLGPEVPLGDFLLRREIGRGGMGIVYEATQLSLSRLVALKILPFAATFDENRIKRFRNESLAVAALDHPNIVDVYGVGCERGVHYYAMRLVDGSPLSAIIACLSSDQTNLDSGRAVRTKNSPKVDLTHANEAQPALQSAKSTARLVAENTFSSGSDRDQGFFRTAANVISQIARALEHAHQQGIVHRDVKPSNLMIDGCGKPWVTDFGLAQFASHETLTMTGDLVGTLRYMSPEQVSDAPVDFRTDIYSLGATLYELVTLRAMFVGDNRAELLQRIRNELPPQPTKINPTLPRELETIVLKATDKEPSDRYASAAAFAADLQAWLDGKPIAARPTSSFGKTWRWCKRNRTVASLLFAIVSLLLATTLVTSWLMLESQRALQAERQSKQNETIALNQERTARQQAQDALEREQSAHAKAEQNANNQRFTANVLKSAFEAAAPLETNKKNITALDVLKAAVDRLESPLQNSHPDEITKATLLNSIGRAMTGLAEYDEAVKVLEKSVAIHRRNSTGIELSVSLSDLGYTYQLSGRYEKALDLATEAYDLAQGIHPNLPATMSALDNLGQAYARMENYAQATVHCRDALERRSKMIGSKSSEAAISRNNLATMLTKTGAIDEAIELYKQNIEIYTDKHGEGHSSTVSTKVNYAFALMDHGDVDEAVKILKRQFDIVEELLGRSHTLTCICANHLATGLRRQAKYNEAIAVSAANLAVLTARYGEQFPLSLNCLKGLATAYSESKQHDLAIPNFQRLLVLTLETKGENHPSSVTATANLAVAIYRSGDHKKAWPLLEKWVESSTQIRGANDQRTREAYLAVAGYYSQAGQIDDATRHYLACLKQLPLEQPPHSKAETNPAFTLAILGLLEIKTQLDQVDAVIRTQIQALNMETADNLVNQLHSSSHRFQWTLLLATSQACQNQFDACESTLSSMSEIAHQPPPIAVAQISFLRSMIQAAKDPAGDAEQKLLAAAQIVFDQAKTPADRAHARWIAKRLASFYTQQGNTDAAQRWLDLGLTMVIW